MNDLMKCVFQFMTKIFCEISLIVRKKFLIEIDEVKLPTKIAQYSFLGLCVNNLNYLHFNKLWKG